MRASLRLSRTGAVLLLSAAMLAMSACGGGTEPRDLQADALAVVGGNNQRAVVKTPATREALPQPVRVMAGVRNGSGQFTMIALDPSYQTGSDTVITNITPVPNAIVNFRVTEEGCGAPFGGAQLTDSTGIAVEVWERGTKANKACKMYARIVLRDGTPVTVDSITATFLPGPADTLLVLDKTNTFHAPRVITDGDSLDITTLLEARDSYGNVLDSTWADSAQWSVVNDGWTLETAERYDTMPRTVGRWIKFTRGPGIWRAFVWSGNTEQLAVWVRAQ